MEYLDLLEHEKIQMVIHIQLYIDVWIPVGIDQCLMTSE